MHSKNLHHNLLGKGYKNYHEIDFLFQAIQLGALNGFNTAGTVTGAAAPVAGAPVNGATAAGNSAVTSQAQTYQGANLTTNATQPQVNLLALQQLLATNGSTPPQLTLANGAQGKTFN